jgi:hypothetical protein
LTLIFFELSFQRRINASHVGARLRNRNSGFETAHQLDEVIVATVHDVVLRKRNRRPQSGLRPIVKEGHTLRHHAAHRERAAANIDLAADYVWITAE